MSRHRSDPGHGSGPPRYPGSFLLTLRAALAELNWRAERWLGYAVVCTDDQGREQVVGLENLYRRARRAERADWPELIRSFLTNVTADQLDAPPTDLAEVADRLLPRLGPPMPRLAEAAVVWAEPLDGTPLHLNLVIDYPQNMFYVTEGLVRDSGQDGAAWRERALANLRALTPPDCLEVVHEESGIRQCNVGDAYDAARALLLDTVLPQAVDDGSFVALPGRDELLVLPVTRDALAFLPLLKLLAEKDHKSAPYAISDLVYWVQGGRWHVFGVDLEGESVQVRPPREFIPVFERLAPDLEDELQDDEVGEEDSGPPSPA
jgi:hypothetical protein